MPATSERTPSQQFSEHQLVEHVCCAPDAWEAHQRFKRHADALKDWQIIFAQDSDTGTIKLLDHPLGDAGVATSIFRGRSLWLMDAPFVTQSDPVGFRGGTAMFVDSNVASYIRAIAYEEFPRLKALEGARLVNQLDTKLAQLNPYLYLWEAARSWDARTMQRCKESVAAMYALSASGGRLSAEWGRRYRSDFREHAELLATGLIAEFKSELTNGRLAGHGERLDLSEAILVRTQIIQLSSNKSHSHKLAQLVTYMHEELATLMLRELIVCGDILMRSKRSRLAGKLNSIQNSPTPLALIRNCAWDMYIPRILDTLTAVTVDKQLDVDFYIAEVLTLDGDVADVLSSTKLSALAVHPPSRKTFPFFGTGLTDWLHTHLKPKQMDAVAWIFQGDAFLDRANRRPSASLSSLLDSDREHLLHLIRKRKG